MPENNLDSIPTTPELQELSNLIRRQGGELVGIVSTDFQQPQYLQYQELFQRKSQEDNLQSFFYLLLHREIIEKQILYKKQLLQTIRNNYFQTKIEKQILYGEQLLQMVRNNYFQTKIDSQALKKPPNQWGNPSYATSTVFKELTNNNRKRRLEHPKKPDQSNKYRRQEPAGPTYP